MEKFIYDYNHRFLIWKNKDKMSIASLVAPERKPILFVLNNYVYESILDASLISESKDKYTLLVACKVININ